jgi:hypothetical protein
VSSDAVATIVVGVLSTAAALAGIVRKPRLRDELKADLDLYNALPESSQGREALLSSIERRIQRLVDVDDLARMDPSGLAIGLVMIGGFGWLTYWAADRGGLWLLMAAAAALLGAIGFSGVVTSMRRQLRDEKGNAIPSATHHAGNAQGSPR